MLDIVTQILDVKVGQQEHLIPLQKISHYYPILFANT